MKRIFLFLLGFLPIIVFSQAVTNLNVRYWYDPQAEVAFEMEPVRLQNNVDVYYKLMLQLSSYTLTDYSITWEKRDFYTQRTGEVLTPENTDLSTPSSKQGKISLALPEKPWLLLAKVTNNSSGNSWIYFIQIEAKFPVNGYLKDKDGVHVKPYVEGGKEYTVWGSGDDKPLHVFYYNEKFPAGSPPFAEKENKVDRFLFADSSFSIQSGSSLLLKREGLYLFQADTNSAEGFAVRTEEASYPKFTKMVDLTEPLIFVTTQEEYNELLAANNEKPKFDKVILDITKDKDRARNFMKSYFKRVESANLYFTSYKEGWKTDRGMIYLIFGLPEEVSRNDNNEIWYYKNFQTRFTFVRAGSVYNPNNYVLLRDKRFTERWFNTIDLWRKSRY
jgi:GWxTD domain-containing protein